MNELSFIDLFAGAGGLSEGFLKEGFKPVVHVEMNKDACDTVKTRLAYHHLYSTHQHSIYQDYLHNKINRQHLWNSIPDSILNSVMNVEISESTIKDIFKEIDTRLSGNKVDIIVGGPPCQAYSLVGRSRDPKGMKGDKRNFLFRYYASFLLRYKPKYFVFENVLGLLTAGNKKYLKEMLELFAEAGYSADYRILNSTDFGVLQNRRRVIIIGKLGRKKFLFPEIGALNNSFEIKKHLFSDLPALNPGEHIITSRYTKPNNEYLLLSDLRNGQDTVTQHMCRAHNERDLEIYEIAIEKWLNDQTRLNYKDLPKRLRTHNNLESFLDRYKVVNPFGHSHTVVAHISQDGHYYIYPDLKQVRSISVREAARIQSFPDNYHFEGGRTSIFKQIGNAVPPLMAKAIAHSIKENLL